jgi:hypothetical protein
MRRILLFVGLLGALVAAGATTALKLTKPVIAQQHTDAALPIDPAILRNHLQNMQEEMALP